MITIGICDDKQEERDCIKACLNGFSKAEGINMAIYEYSSGEEMAMYLADIRFDLVFLDIYMGGMTGIDVAKQIRETSEACLIVFATSSPDFAIDAYSFRAFHYLLKPLQCEEIVKVIKDSVQHLQHQIGRASCRERVYVLV